jgi:hypothetical protein
VVLIPGFSAAIGVVRRPQQHVCTGWHGWLRHRTPACEGIADRPAARFDEQGMRPRPASPSSQSRSTPGLFSAAIIRDQ